MAKSVLTFLILAIATLQAALTMNCYCNTPRCINYGGFKLYNNKYHVGDRVCFNCDNGNGIYGSSSAKCLYSYSRNFRCAYWSHKPPVCRCDISDIYVAQIICPSLKLTGLKPGFRAIHSCDCGLVLKGI